MDRDIFANAIAPADDDAARFASVFQVLRNLPNGGEGEDDRVPADFRGALDHTVRGDAHSVVHNDVIADDRIGTDDHVVAQFGSTADQSRGMNNGRHGSCPLSAGRRMCGRSAR